MQKQFVNQTELAQIIGVCTRTVRNMEDEGLIQRDPRFKSPRYSVEQVLGRSGTANQPQHAA